MMVLLLAVTSAAAGIAASNPKISNWPKMYEQFEAIRIASTSKIISSIPPQERPVAYGKPLRHCTARDNIRPKTPCWMYFESHGAGGGIYIADDQGTSAAVTFARYPDITPELECKRQHPMPPGGGGVQSPELSHCLKNIYYQLHGLQWMKENWGRDWQPAK